MSEKTTTQVQFSLPRRWRDRWLTRPWHPWHTEIVYEFPAATVVMTGMEQREEGGEAVDVDFEITGPVERRYRNRLWHELRRRFGWKS